MKAHTDYLWFNTKRRQEIIDITAEVEKAVEVSKVVEGMALVSAMHISASVFVNDHESGLWEDGNAWDPDWTRSHRSDHGGPAGLRPVAAGVLWRVGRTAKETGDHQGPGGLT